MGVSGVMRNCNICGGTSFLPAHRGRLAHGVPPACAACGSYERHRIVRDIYASVRPVIKSWNVLQFAPDRSLDATWVARLDFSTFGGANSLNIMDTGLAVGSYELIVSNHVLEHVPDDLTAIREMLRVVGIEGVVHMTIPSPTTRWETRDWGFADETRNFHYRDYGADFLSNVIRSIPGAKGMAVVGTDPVTGIPDVVFFLAQAEGVLACLSEYLQRKPFPIVRVE